jgi:DNA-directed RNA polymerase specialized sigma subunit
MWLQVSRGRCRSSAMWNWSISSRRSGGRRRLTNASASSWLVKGSRNALLSLLESYRPLLRMIARRFFLPGGDVDDLLQEATIGLIKAIRDFQPDLGLPFRPFASCVSPAR